VAVTERDAYANLVLPGLLTDRGLTGRDAAFATELAYGTLRATGTLDAVLDACVDRPLAEVDPRLRDLLRLGAYQLLRMRVPSHAAVSATVDLTRAVLTDGPSRFANAVLRRVAERELGDWLDRLTAGLPPDEALALRTSHPGWIVRAFADALGVPVTDPDLAAALAADDAPAGTHLVARPSRIDRDALVEMAGGVPGPWSPYAVRMGGGDPGALAAIRDGRAGVQDEGSQLCALALAAVPLDGGPDRRWLDLCAGPGGKAALLGSLAIGRGAEITAVEVARHRVGLVTGATAGLPVTVLHADGRTVGSDPALPAEGFDRVLLDAPCTGLGALRRRPEARWRRRPEDVPALTVLQRELLTAALRGVRPGGVVAYVTCSPHRAETAGVVAEVLRSMPAARLLDARPYLPGVPDLGAGPSVQLWPHRHGTDAMFCSLLGR
jgi:16S rRNA (cytosine967-C5)-methyltransferase